MIEILTGLMIISFCLLIIFVFFVVVAIFESKKVPLWVKIILGIVITLVFSYLVGFAVLHE